MLWLWVLSFKLMCYRPPLLSMLLPLYFCHTTIILVVAICECRPIFLVILLCSWLPPSDHCHGYGHLLVFLVVLLLAIAVAMVVFFLFLVASS